MPLGSIKTSGFRKLLAIIALIAVPMSLMMVNVVMRSQIDQVRALRETTEETVATRMLLNDLLVIHLDAETGLRGYAVTQDRQFLAPYRTALMRRQEIFDRLKSDGGPAVVAALPDLQRLSNAKLENAAASVSDIEAGRFRQARMRIAAGQGRIIMDAIRTRIARLDRIEANRLERLTLAGSGPRELIENTVTAILVGLAILLAAVTFIVGRSIHYRRVALQRARSLAERQRAMFDGAVDGMLQLDEKGHILHMNPSISRMFGYSAKDLVGHHNLILMAEQYTLADSQAWLASVGAAGEHGAGRRQEFIGRRIDGTTFDTELAISRVEDSAGRRRYVAAIRDISDRKRAEQMKTEFVSTVSHELRTPLTSISGSLGLLGAGAVGPLEDKAKRLIQIAHSNCERLIRLINDILDIEKIESGKMEFDLRRIQVGPLVDRTVASMAGFAEKHQVSVTVTLPPWPQFIVGDPDRLEQLLTNLLSNAIKHSPSGGKVEIFSDHHAGTVRIEVRDRGAGVPLAFRERIFGKFAMADASDSRVKNGTGLGLSIAREIARRHGGEVGFEDRDGGGTSFYFDIGEADCGDIIPITLDESLPRILHVDDDDDCLSVVASAFESKATIVSTTTIEQMKKLAGHEHFDGAIIDAGMIANGTIDLNGILRSKTRELPIVLFTADDGPHDMRSADRVLVKSRASLDNLVDVTLDLVSQKRKAG